MQFAMKGFLVILYLSLFYHSVHCQDEEFDEVQREEDKLPQYLKDDGIRRVAKLTKDHFNKTLRASRMMVVLFYYSSSEKPDPEADRSWKTDQKMLEIVARVLQPQGVTVGVVNVAENMELVKEMGVKYSGAIMVYHRGKRIEYFGHRSADVLVGFLHKMFEPPVSFIESKKQKTSFEDIDGSKVIAYLEKDSPEIKAFEESATQHQPLLPFFAVSDKKLAKSFRLKKPKTIQLLKPYEKPVNYPADKTITEENINNFIAQNKRGILTKQLVSGVVSAIDGLRDHVSKLRDSELRREVYAMDRQAQDWVGKVEKEAVESLTGYRDGVDTMMEVHVVGLSHHSAPVEVREKLAVAQADWNAYAQELVEFAKDNQSGYLVPEVSVLSTCNRFELYFASPEMKKFDAVEAVHAFLSHKSGLSAEELEPYLFSHTGEDAIQHLFEVSSGLDSLVLGEAQILAQVKACHEHAIQKISEDVPVAGSGGKIVAKMLNAAIRMGKLVRSRTKIGKGSVSVSSAAVELMMSRAMQDLRKPANKLHVSIIGAGKMSRLLLLALFSKHPDIKVTLVNRSVEKAQEVLDDDMVKNRGGANASVAPLDQMFDVMRQSDVTFTATGSKVPIIHAKDLQELERNLMLVDISVPLNVAGDCAEVERVTSYSVDDLKKVVEANAMKRQAEVKKARRFITEEVAKFKCWQASQGAVPYLAALQAMAEKIRREEYAKMEHKLKGLQEKEKDALDKLTRHLVDQLFRPLYYSMKENEPISEKRSKIMALREIFRLAPLYKRGLLTNPQEPAQLNA